LRSQNITDDEGLSNEEIEEAQKCITDIRDETAKIHYENAYRLSK
jgi:hypothetical protein